MAGLYELERRNQGCRDELCDGQYGRSPKLVLLDVEDWCIDKARCSGFTSLVVPTRLARRVDAQGSTDGIWQMRRDRRCT